MNVPTRSKQTRSWPMACRPPNMAQKWDSWIVPSTRKLLWTSMSHLDAVTEHCSNGTMLVSLLSPPAASLPPWSPPHFNLPVPPAAPVSSPFDCLPPPPPSSPPASLMTVHPLPLLKSVIVYHRPLPPPSSLHHPRHHRHRRDRHCICLSSCGTGHPPRPTQRIKVRL